MKTMIVAVMALLGLMALPAIAASEHAGHGKAHDMGHGSGPAHEEVVDGIKVTFTIQTMKEAMKAMGMQVPKGVKETHHISVSFKDVKGGRQLSEGEVKVKVQGPDKQETTKDLLGMQGHFGADFDMTKKGKYGVMSKFQVKDGKVRQAKFWYEVK